MLLEIDVIAQGNSPMDLNRVFDLLSEPREIQRVFTADPLDRDGWYDVTGWESGNPCPARAVLAEDSGDGVILLIYGGEDGIRLRPAGSSDRWDVGSGDQWGEPCLMLGQDTKVEE
ncbi:MAG: hypothetical protein ACE5Q6_06135 [Dehalococcoidia bacterium]